MTEQRWRFPRGSGALSPEIMGEIQRRRLFEAITLVIADQGYAKMTVTKIVAQAGMSTKTFYDYFTSKEAAVAAAYGAYAVELETDLAEAWTAPERWSERVRAAIAALLAFGVSRPEMLRFLLVDARDVIAELTALQRQALDRMAGQLRQGRGESDKLAQAAPSLEPMLLAGVAWRVAECLRGEDPAAQLVGLDGELVEFVLAPYLGSGSRSARGAWLIPSN